MSGEKKRKKAVVFFHNSDFVSLDEYIDYMQRDPISKEEAKAADWDKFGEQIAAMDKKK